MDRREIGGHVTQELTKIVFEIRERTTSQFFTVKHPVPDVPVGSASHDPKFIREYLRTISVFATS